MDLDEKAVGEPEQLFRNLAEHSPNMIFVNVGGRVVYANRRCEEVMGYSREELCDPGFEFMVLIAPEHRELIRANLAEHFAGHEVAPYEYALLTRDGRRLEAIITTKLMPYQGQSAILGIITDITERKRAEVVVAASEAKLRAVIDALPYPFFVKDTSLRYTECNPAFLEFLGRSREEIVGRTVYDVAPAEKAEVYHGADQRLLDAGGTQVYESAVAAADGIDHQVIFHKATFAGPDGAVAGIAGSIVDISDRTRAERELSAVSERMRQLIRGTINTIVKIVESRDPFTAGHQLRVAELAYQIANLLGLPAEQRQAIHTAALIHDIGKIHIPAEILAKPGRLTALEFELIRTHSQFGFEILKSIEFPWPVADIVLQHHERQDGSGYPNRLRGAGIRLEARILAVADVVEAMAMHRPYRAAPGLVLALEEVRDHAGTVYDGAAVDACLTLFHRDGFAFSTGGELSDFSIL